MFTWRNEWINKNESIWSILEKFKYANALSNKEFYELTSITSYTSDTYTIKKQKESFKSLVTLTGFDRNRLKKVLGFDLIEYNHNNLKSITHLFNKDHRIESNMRKYLTFCPECLKEGYHSYWHQVAFHDKCPIHNSFLVDRCPKCNKKHKYQFVSNSKSQGFKCVFCNHNYLEDNDIESKMFFYQWNKRNEIPLNEEQKIILWINSRFHEKKAYAYFYTAVKNHANDGLLKIQVQEKYDIMHTIHNIKSTIVSNQTKHALKSRIPGKGVLDSDKELYSSYMTIFKAIARRIRKKDRKIKNSVKEIKSKKIMLNCDSDIFRNVFGENHNKNPEIYYPAYAYIMWCRDIQGFESWDRVENNVLSYRPRFEVPNLYTTIIECNLFRYFKNEFIIHLMNDTSNYKMDFFSVIEHMMAYMFMQHYENWLKSESKHEKKQIPDMGKKISFQMPIFVANYQKCQENGDIEFAYFPCLKIIPSK